MIDRFSKIVLGLVAFQAVSLFILIKPKPNDENIIYDIKDTTYVAESTIDSIDMFDIVIPFILEHEGDRFVRDTSINEVSRRGITLTTYKQYYGRGNINSIRYLKISEAKEIYKYLFWDKNNIDSIVGAGYMKTSIVLMDSEVNLVASRANKFLQGLIGAKKTGIIDEETISKLKSCGISDDILYVKLIRKRRQYYDRLVAKRNVFAKYHAGWNNRLNDIYVFSKEISYES